jgi:hypothetical protein
LTNNFTPKKLPKFTAAICCGTSTKTALRLVQVKKMLARVKLIAPRTANAD